MTVVTVEMAEAARRLVALPKDLDRQELAPETIRAIRDALHDGRALAAAVLASGAKLPPSTGVLADDLRRATIRETIAALGLLEPAARVEVISALGDAYCFGGAGRGCGFEQPAGGHCQCENDL